ncbi:hypothetical protein FHR36_005231 [Kitasatospora paracochleata]|uniref:Transposase n=1 Tax=Kitasatospora paracochleata TaxID=58354 RepID=A0ABT1J3Q1_9ACTN|nr:hypothetical protein [Kitasatospora paracochleata]
MAGMPGGGRPKGGRYCSMMVMGEQLCKMMLTINQKYVFEAGLSWRPMSTVDRPLPPLNTDERMTLESRLDFSPRHSRHEVRGPGR